MTLRNKLHYSRTLVDRAGRELVQAAETEDVPEQALTVINDWRSFHTFPLNSITVVLKQKARRVQDDALVVQRLKRTRSVLTKLTR